MAATGEWRQTVLLGLAFASLIVLSTKNLNTVSSQRRHYKTCIAPQGQGGQDVCTKQYIYTDGGRSQFASVGLAPTVCIMLHY